jgi:predicted metal-binding protein
LVRKIQKEIPEGQLKKDLEKLRQRAIELGATNAEVITTDKVLIDERVRAKCLYPRCRSYGTNANCPPYTLDLEQTRKIVSRYGYAIFSRTQVPAEEISGKKAGKDRLFLKYALRAHEIVARIESEAFFDGYHLALGFANGSCKHILCSGVECSAIVPGQGCRHSLKARASMEAVGMDVYGMAANVGWDVYPIGVSLSPSEVPFGAMYGLILIH